MKSRYVIIVAITFLIGITGNFSTAQNEIELKDGTVKIGIARWVENEDFTDNIAGFKESLEEYGFKEGVNTEYFIENPNGDKNNQRKIIQKFIDNDVDLIYSLTTPGTLIAKEMTQDIPIVFSIVTFPVSANIIESFESSGNNLVGTSNFVSVEKQLDLIYDISKSKKIGFVHRDGEPNSAIQFDLMNEYSVDKGIQIIDVSSSNLDDLKSSIDEVILDVDALYNACDTLVQSGGEEISISAGLANNKPVFSCNLGGIKSGALAGNVADFKTIGKLAGVKAVLILHGANPSNILSEKHKGDHIFVNEKSAKILEIEIPEHLQHILSGRFD